MGRSSVLWTWTVKQRTGSLDKEDREMGGFEVVNEKVMCASLMSCSAWTTAIVLLSVDDF